MATSYSNMQGSYITYSSVVGKAAMVRSAGQVGFIGLILWGEGEETRQSSYVCLQNFFLYATITYINWTGYIVLEKLMYASITYINRFILVTMEAKWSSRRSRAFIWTWNTSQWITTYLPLGLLPGSISSGKYGISSS